MTVARPDGVNPRMSVASLLQVKWSRHLWVLGLNSGTTAPPTGSGASTFVYSWLLHPWQDHARFNPTVRPPRLRGTMCSTEKDCMAYAVWLRQYSQQSRALSATKRRRVSETRSSA